ncbi:MAG: AAA family ATPase, partial [Blautia sp.]|nr:AAA family ATPase [Blautia sp.]
MAKLVALEDIKNEKYKYLWNPYMPYGAVSVFQGQGGYGKTSLVCKIMAEASWGIYPPRLHKGGMMACEELSPWQEYCLQKMLTEPERERFSFLASEYHNGFLLEGIDYEEEEEEAVDVPNLDVPRFRTIGEPIKMTYVSRENHYGNIIRMKYQAYGGRPGFVRIVDESDGRFVTSEDLILEMIADSKLLVIDPIYAFVEGRLEDNSDVAEAIEHLESAARKTGACILLLNNLSKTSSASDYNSGLGASNLKNLVRSLFKIDMSGKLRYIEGIKINISEFKGKIGLLRDELGRYDYINYEQAEEYLLEGMSMPDDMTATQKIA